VASIGIVTASLSLAFDVNEADIKSGQASCSLYDKGGILGETENGLVVTQ